MVELKCQHCEYRWDYKGKSTYYAPCPRCHYKVFIKKACIFKELENISFIELPKPKKLIQKGHSLI